MGDKKTEKEVTPKEVMEAVDSLRKEVETHGDNSSQVKEMEDKVEKTLKTYDDQNQKLVTDLADARKETTETAERIKALELEVAKSGAQAGVNFKESPEYKSLMKFAKVGMLEMNQDEVKTLRTDNTTSGGALITGEFDNQIIKKITEISAMRSVCRVKTVGKKSLEMPTRTGLLEASYEGEAAQNTLSQSTYGSEQITAMRLTVTVPVTQDQLMDSNFDMQSLINADVAEAMAFKGGNRQVLGTGHKQPEGFTINADVRTAQSTSAVSAVVDIDDAITLSGTLKIGYNPMYGFNRKTLSSFRKEQSTAGGYLWVPGGAAGEPSTLNGYSYIILPDMADIASNSYSLVFADFMRGYTIIDRTGMMVIRDDVTNARSAIVNFTFHRYDNGMVVLPEAIRLLKTKA